MEKQLGMDYPESQRALFLRDNCDKVESKGYMKPFSPEEILEKKELLAETSIEINDIEIEKKEVVSEFKKRLDPLVEMRTGLLKGIKEKAEFVKEDCFKFVDQDTRQVGYYNAEGLLVDQRPAMPDEMQGTIFQIGRKTGTND